MSASVDLPYCPQQTHDGDLSHWTGTFLATTSPNLDINQQESAGDGYPADVLNQMPYDNEFEFPLSMDTMPTWKNSAPTEMHGAQQQEYDSFCGVKLPMEGSKQDYQQLEMSIARLNDLVDIYGVRLRELEEQFNQFQEWTGPASRIINNFQLERQGLSPIQKQFGYVLREPAKKQKTSSRDKKSQNKRNGSKDGVNAKREIAACV